MSFGKTNYRTGGTRGGADRTWALPGLSLQLKDRVLVVDLTLVICMCTLAAEFKWEDVKNDKYRENYLGHSVNAPVGRWQKNKDLTWYAKASKADRAAAAQQELALAKQRDEDLMNEALYVFPFAGWMEEGLMELLMVHCMQGHRSKEEKRADRSTRRVRDEGAAEARTVGARWDDGGAC